MTLKLKSLKQLFLLAGIVLLSASTGWSQTKVIAHRGYWNVEGSAQNSITALQKSNEIGVYGSEFDVLITVDGVPVVNHDDSISGLHIEMTTYEKLKDLKLSNGETISTLEDYLIEGKKYPNTKLILEIKPLRRVVNEDRLVKKVVEMVKKHGLEQQTEYISFSMNICKELIRQVPNAEVSYLNGNVSPDDLKELGFSGLDYNYRVLMENPDWIARAKELGLTVNVWTVNLPEYMEWFIEQGVDFITTDHPLELQSLLENK